MIDRLDTVCLKVSDIEQASSWYKEILDFKEVYKGENYRIFSIGESAVPLTIEQGEKREGNTTYPIFFSKEVETLHESLKKRGVETEEIQVDGVNKFFSFYDLDGNKLQVCYWE